MMREAQTPWEIEARKSATQGCKTLGDRIDAQLVLCAAKRKERVSEFKERLGWV